MNERLFITRLHHSFTYWTRSNGKTGFFYKIVDCGYKTPMDIIAVLPGGRAWACEAKYNRLKGKINMASLFSNRWHELRSLIHLQSCGALAHVIVGWNPTGRLVRAFAFRPEICEGMAKNGSEDLEELVAHGMCVELPAIGDGLWSMEPILK